MTPDGRLSIPDVIEAFRAYRALPGNGAWGTLHIVLDDGNVSDDYVKFCIDTAGRRGDAEGERLARVLLLLSKTQRAKMKKKLSKGPAP